MKYFKIRSFELLVRLSAESINGFSFKFFSTKIHKNPHKSIDLKARQLICSLHLLIASLSSVLSFCSKRPRCCIKGMLRGRNHKCMEIECLHRDGASFKYFSSANFQFMSLSREKSFTGKLKCNRNLLVNLLKC